MNLNMWSCTSSSLFLAQCSLDFRSTKRALFEVLSTKSSTKCQKKQGTLKAVLNPNFTSTKLSALVYNFRKEYERYLYLYYTLYIKQALFDASHVLLSRPPNGHAACLSVESDGQLSLVVKVSFIVFFFHGFSVVFLRVLSKRGSA